MPRKSRQQSTPNDDPQWQQAWEQPDALDASRKQVLLHDIHQRMAGNRRKKQQLFYISMGAAAAILVAFLIRIPRTEDLPVHAWRELATHDSARKVQLEDGSVMWLAPRSAVKVYPDFRSKRNTLLTKGTVFFSVARDTAHPFSISVNNQLVTVLGTQFSISRLDSTDIQLTVKEGKVALVNTTGNNILTAGQQVYTRNGKTGNIQPVDPLTADWWAAPRIRLFNISLGTLIHCVESYYGVKLSRDHIDEALKVSLTWDMTVSLEDNLKILNAVTGYTIH